MFPVTVPAIGLLLSLLWSGCATSEPTMPSDNKSESVPAPAIDPASVELTKPMHFTAPDGSDVVAAAGTYHVDGGEGSQLLLSPGDGATPIVIAALMSEHDLDLLGPLALILSPADGPFGILTRNVRSPFLAKSSAEKSS